MLLNTSVPVVSHDNPCSMLHFSSAAQLPSSLRALQPLERESSRIAMLVSACEMVLFQIWVLSDPET